MSLRPNIEGLNDIEIFFNKTKLAEHMIPDNSYVFVVELSNYLAKGENPYENPEIQARLYPILSYLTRNIFYPMNKRH